jgi:hypothetical protein
MTRLAALLLPLLALTAAPLGAKPTAQRTTAVSQVESGGVQYILVPPPPLPRGIASFGPFRVLDGKRAALVDITDAQSPEAFEQMLAAFPGLATIEMLECPGTIDDNANLELGKMIRAAGMETHVPKDGSVRSGAMELFLAGVRRSAEQGSEFAVHSWKDEYGKQARDYPADAPENTKYVAYYQAMGMSEDEAARFYAMTIAASYEDATWLTANAIRTWVALK